MLSIEDRDRVGGTARERALRRHSKSAEVFAGGPYRFCIRRLCGRMGISRRAGTADVVCGVDLALAGNRVQGKGSAWCAACRGDCGDVVFLCRGQYWYDGGDVSDRRHSLASGELWRKRHHYDHGGIGLVIKRQAEAVKPVLLSDDRTG